MMRSSPRRLGPAVSRLEWSKQIPILDVAGILGLQVHGNSAHCWRKAKHATGDKHPSLGFDVAKNRFKCFVCDQRPGSVVDLVMGVLAISLPDALRWFQCHFDMPYHVRQRPRPADFDPRKVTLSTIIRSGLWAGLTDSQRNILNVMWDARDDEGTVTESYSKILRRCGLSSRKTFAGVIRTFEQWRLIEVLRRNRAMSTYRFLEDERFLQLQRECKNLVPLEGTSLNDEETNLVPPKGTSSVPPKLVPLEGTGSLAPQHKGLCFPIGELDSEFSEREQQVLRLAARGFQLFPCKPHSKEPAVSNWRKLATADPKKLVRWFTDFPEANWAVATGPVSGIFVVDLDGEQGERSWSELCQQNGGEVSTLTVRTPRGRHPYFCYPVGSEIRNSASKIALSVDVRGQGGYVLCPPSIHPSGTPYQWLGPESQPVAEAPSWLLELRQQASEKGNGVGLPISEPVPPAEALPLMPCYVHRGKTPHWKRGEDWLCVLCTPNPAEVRVR
jgi:hypothetical protein